MEGGWVVRLLACVEDSLDLSPFRHLDTHHVKHQSLFKFLPHVGD